jgi:hypothetical protein
MAVQEDGLSVDDLMNVLKIINTSTERGAFKANELSFVGGIYDKFVRFIKQAQAAESTVNANETTENERSNTNGSK